ncbi:MAG: hypothetical protein JSS81_26460 [Acidobacteria bacterium]|nr:hypothetical protein [Acidobacteriota bacterium]
MRRFYAHSEVPEKSSKHHPLTPEQKRFSRQLAGQRTMVEHRNREYRIFRICKDRYRGKHKNYGRTWKLVSAIVSLKLSTRHLKDASR